MQQLLHVYLSFESVRIFKILKSNWYAWKDGGGGGNNVSERTLKLLHIIYFGISLGNLVGITYTWIATDVGIYNCSLEVDPRRIKEQV